MKLISQDPADYVKPRRGEDIIGAICLAAFVIFLIAAFVVEFA